MKPIAPIVPATPAVAGEAPLKNAKHETFAHKVAEGETAVDSYRFAFDYTGPRQSNAYQLATRVNCRPEVIERVAFLKRQKNAEWVFDFAEAKRLVLEDARNVLAADAAELTRYRRLNCRHCHGRDHAYRWRDEKEFWRALADVSEAQAKWDNQRPDRRVGQRPELPTDEGGYGFRRNHPPAPDCPECEGEGIEDVFIADTQRLKGPARALYNGVKKTKNGIEVLTRDKEAARQLLAKHAGLVTDDVNVRGGLAVASVVAQVPPEVAAAIAKKLLDEY